MKHPRIALLCAALLFAGMTACGTDAAPAAEPESSAKTSAYQTETTVSAVQSTDAETTDAETTDAETTDAETTAASAAADKTDEPDSDDLSFENSYTAALCEILDRQHFSVLQEVRYADEVLGTCLYEVNGERTHVKNTDDPETEYSIENEYYNIDGSTYICSGGQWRVGPLDRPRSLDPDAKIKNIEALFFNSGTSPRDMQLLSRTYDGSTVTETFSGLGGLFITFDRETGDILSSGYKSSVQTVLSFSEEVGALELPAEAKAAAEKQESE